MANNTELNAGSGGDIIASDDVAGVKYQIVKLASGAEDAATMVSAAAPLPVTDAASAALLGTIDADTGNAATSLAVIDDWDESDRAKVNIIVGQAGVQGASGAVSASTQRVVLATDVALPAGTNALGTVTAVGGAAHDAAVSGNPNLIGGYASATAPSDVSGDGDAVRAWLLRNGAQCMQLTGAGTLVAAGGGTEATALRVTIATDSTGVLSIDDNGSSLTVDGTVTADTELPAAAALADNTANPTAPAVGAFAMCWDGANWDRVPGTSADGVLVNLGANNDVVASGVAAHDAAVSGNPVLIGLEARTTDGTAVASGDAVRGIADTLGKQVTLIGAIHDQQIRGLTNYTTSSAADVIALVASTRIVVMGILVVNGHATVSTKVTIRDGTTSKVTGYAAAAGGGFALCSSTPIFIGTAGTAITAICGTTGADVDVNIWGYKILN